MIALVLGGARSGKSEVAERLAARLSEPVTFLATGVATDPEMASRIEAHRARRPRGWMTIEPEPGAGVVRAVAATEGTLLLDSLGTWVASAPGMSVDAAALAGALRARAGDAVVVSDETGLGVHPSSDAGRRFRDVLGDVNRAVAEIADDVLFVVAGRVLRLESAGDA